MESQPHPAASAVLRRDGRYLLVKRGAPPAELQYAFPGGRCEPDEAPETAALRELQEETGIAARNPRFFAQYDLPSEGWHYFLSVYIVDFDYAAEPTASDDALEAEWFTPAEIAELPVPESVRDCLLRLEKFFAGT